jgi:hypothetical protein
VLVVVVAAVAVVSTVIVGKKCYSFRCRSLTFRFIADRCPCDYCYFILFGERLSHREILVGVHQPTPPLSALFSIRKSVSYFD